MRRLRDRFLLLPFGLAGRFGTSGPLCSGSKIAILQTWRCGNGRSKCKRTGLYLLTLPRTLLNGTPDDALCGGHKIVEQPTPVGLHCSARCVYIHSSLYVGYRNVTGGYGHWAVDGAFKTSQVWL